MIARRQQPQRPFSRLDNFNFDQTPSDKKVMAVGIPEKLMSASKQFPRFTQKDDDKQNEIVMAPKKQQKINSKKQNQENDHVFRRRILSDNANGKENKVNIKTKITEVLSSVTNNYTNGAKIAEHLDLKRTESNPFSQALRKEEQIKQTKKACVVSEQKSIARRVKQRIEAQNAKKGERNRKSSIGEEAYLPFPLKQLRQKIGDRSRKCSGEYYSIVENIV